MSVDLEKSRREYLRWLVLQSLHSAEPMGASEGVLLAAIRGVLHDITATELRVGLSYLHERNLLALSGQQTGSWHGKLSRHGFDIVEYTVDCEPGIARPVKYWGTAQ